MRNNTTFLFHFLLLTLINVGIYQAHGQKITGCTDVQANNFNPNATTNDGSCTYNITVYNPSFKYILPNEIEENSGLAFYQEKLWTINDSGGLPIIYGLDSTTGAIVQHVIVENATNIDWESLAIDEEYIYIGDFGNNAGNRDNLAIYKLPLAEFTTEDVVTIFAEKITFKYEDHPGKIKKRKENNYDCEAFIAVGDSLYLFSKNWGNQQTRLYSLPTKTGDYQAKLLTSFDTQGMITGADINPTNNEIVLTGYVNQTWVPFIWILSDYHDLQFFSGNKRKINLVNLSATQVEAIAFTRNHQAIITSEGHLLFSQTAFNISTEKWTGTTASGETEYPSHQFDFKISPNPVKGNKIHIDFNSHIDSELNIELFDSTGKLIRLPKPVFTRNKEGLNRIKIKTNHLMPGVYFVRIINGKQQVKKKLIVQ